MWCTGRGKSGHIGTSKIETFIETRWIGYVQTGGDLGGGGKGKELIYLKTLKG